MEVVDRDFAAELAKKEEVDRLSPPPVRRRRRTPVEEEADSPIAPRVPRRRTRVARTSPPVMVPLESSSEDDDSVEESEEESEKESPVASRTRTRRPEPSTEGGSQIL
jgi:hypothetical protein